MAVTEGSAHVVCEGGAVQSQRQLVVILVRPAGPLNVGLVARACANFGAQLRIVDGTADLRSVEFRMTAVHAEHVVAKLKTYECFADAVGDLDWVLGTCGLARDPRLAMLGPGEVADAATRRGVGTLGLVFGNEAQGLRNEELARCDAYVRIPASAEQPSLNLSHAVAVLLSRLYTEAPTAEDEPRAMAASRGALDALRESFVALSRASGYFERASETRLPASLDRMFRRWGMQAGDVRTMMGIVQHALRRYDSP